MEFPSTRASALLALRSDDPEARQRSLERLARVYYRPAYAHVRFKWRKTPEETEDLLQEFFAKVVERGFLGQYDAERGRFRTFLRVCLDHFVLSAIAKAERQKRGGGVQVSKLDVEEAEVALAHIAASSDAEDVFDREWVRTVFTRSVTALKDYCDSVSKPHLYRAFELYDLDDSPKKPSYAEVAKTMGVDVTDVTNYLHAARAELRRRVLETLHEITSDEAEFREEAQAVLGLRFDEKG